MITQIERTIGYEGFEKYYFVYFSKASKKEYTCIIEERGEERVYECECRYAVIQMERDGMVNKLCRHLKECDKKLTDLKKEYDKFDKEYNEFKKKRDSEI